MTRRALPLAVALSLAALLGACQAVPSGAPPSTTAPAAPASTTPTTNRPQATTTTSTTRPPRTTTTTKPPASTSTTTSTTTPGGGGGGTGGGSTPNGGWWKPTADRPLKLAWVLEGALDVSDTSKLTADVYDIDPDYNPKSTVELLHRMGKKVICYVDAGVYEDYRADAGKFPKSVIGAPDDGWEGSYWLDIRQIEVLRPIMQARIDKCAAMGFDAVEPDETVNYSNDSGFPLTYADQLAYNKAFASWVHDRGMSVGLKGDIEQAKDLEPYFDWTLNEECYLYSECGDYSGGLTNFTRANKAVWIAEYPEEHSDEPFDWVAIQADAAAHRWNVAQYDLGLPRKGTTVYMTTGW